MSINRIPSANRSRARGLFAVLRASNVPPRLSYVATVAAYGRTLIRGYYWDMLPSETRRLVAGLAVVA
jgi:hypothetical protein